MCTDHVNRGVKVLLVRGENFGVGWVRAGWEGNSGLNIRNNGRGPEETVLIRGST